MEARAYWIQIDGPDGYCFKLDGLTFELVGLLVRMLLVKRQFENARDACVSVDGNTHFSEEDMMQNGAHDSQPYRPRKLRVESLRVLERLADRCAPATGAELARELSTSGGIHSTLRRLREYGYVQDAENRSDSRRKPVVITEYGLSLLTEHRSVDVCEAFTRQHDACRTQSVRSPGCQANDLEESSGPGWEERRDLRFEIQIGGPNNYRVSAHDVPHILAACMTDTLAHWIACLEVKAPRGPVADAMAADCRRGGTTIETFGRDAPPLTAGTLSLLEALAANNTPTSISDMRERLRTGVHIYNRIKQLERRGLVRTASIPDDKRRTLVFVTPAGKSQLNGRGCRVASNVQQRTTA